MPLQDIHHAIYHNVARRGLSDGDNGLITDVLSAENALLLAVTLFTCIKTHVSYSGFSQSANSLKEKAEDLTEVLVLNSTTAIITILVRLN